MNQVIGIDLGGTAIKLGRFLREGTCQESITIATPQPSVPEAVVEAIAPVVNQFNAGRECIALGIGTPGHTDAAGRIGGGRDRLREAAGRAGRERLRPPRQAPCRTCPRRGSAR